MAAATEHLSHLDIDEAAQGSAGLPAGAEAATPPRPPQKPPAPTTTDVRLGSVAGERVGRAPGSPDSATAGSPPSAAAGGAAGSTSRATPSVSCKGRVTFEGEGLGSTELTVSRSGSEASGGANLATYATPMPPLEGVA